MQRQFLTVDDHQVRCGDVADLLAPARAPGRAEEGEAPIVHVSQDIPDPVAADHIEVRVHDDDEARVCALERQAQTLGVVIAAQELVEQTAMLAGLGAARS